MRQLLLAPLFAALVGCGHAPVTAFKPITPPKPQAMAARAVVKVATIKQAGPAEAYKALVAAHGKITLIDVRQPEEFNGGHAAGALLQPLPDLAAWSAKLDKKAAYMIICHSGNRSMKASTALVAAGFEDITNIQGGTSAWEAAGLPMQQ
ncbi:MAG: rhodanese-like protein [Cyanobacteria bacterium RYN_339]|nr:rhodanese-like protein [Cyanobacteria bacterium RYN_339]